MSFPLPRWIAHRGGGSLAPENTLAGIRLAARMGFAAVEFDVMLSADGTPVLFHDETLERTTNGHGLVSATSDAVLFRLDAGDGEPVPRYVDAVALCRRLGLLANVEIKPATGFERETAECVARLSSELWQGAAVQPLISSFSLEALTLARDLAPHIPRGLLCEHVPGDWLSVVRLLGAVTLHCAADCLSADVLAEARANGIPVLCFTVNSEPAANALFEQGVSTVFTDRLDLFARETTAYKGLHLGG
jgi:glycerophosphoryl diester phosphodiesterase